MRRIIRILTLISQIVLLLIFPLFGDKEAAAPVLITWLITFFLSIIFPVTYFRKPKYLYPVITMLLYLLSTLIFYGEANIAGSVVFLIASFVGILIGNFASRFSKVASKLHDTNKELFARTFFGLFDE